MWEQKPRSSGGGTPKGAESAPSRGPRRVQRAGKAQKTSASSASDDGMTTALHGGDGVERPPRREVQNDVDDACSRRRRRRRAGYSLVEINRDSGPAGHCPDGDYHVVANDDAAVLAPSSGGPASPRHRAGKVASMAGGRRGAP